MKRITSQWIDFKPRTTACPSQNRGVGRASNPARDSKSEHSSSSISVASKKLKMPKNWTQKLAKILASWDLFLAQSFILWHPF